ncbi:MAG TPA: LemA family protein [Candidatus Saccharimonadales bacterium]|jgi:LemA protein
MGPITFIIVAVVVVIIIIALVVIYNKLVRLNVRSEEAWSDITVQLKRRYDLIPNLINTVKGYAQHESGVFERVTAARSNALNAQGVAETAAAEGEFTKTLKSLFAVSEAYPDLKASQNFQQLQAELVDTEDKIQASRRFYNGVVRDFNTSRTVFPVNFLAGIFGFKKDKVFFELDEAQTAAVQSPVEVKF